MISRNNDSNGECLSPVGHPLFDHVQSHNACSSSNLSRSSAISVCSSGNLSSASGSKCMVTVVLPGCKKQNAIELVVDLKSRLDNILSQIAVLVGLVDVEFFGLAIKTSVPDDEYRFLELDSKLQSVLPREVLKGLRRSTSGFFRKQTPSFFEQSSAITLYLRVICFVDNPALMRDCVALQLYFDQLRENALEYGQLIVPEACFTLAVLALQADQQPVPYSSFFEGKRHVTPDDMSASTTDSLQNLPVDVLSLYIPDWLIRSQGASFIALQLPKLQQELSEMSRLEAQLMYCRYASQRPFHHNIHMYGIKRKKTDSYFTLWLGIGFRGLDVFEDVEGRFKKLIGAFDWASIAKIQTNGKSIDMRVVGGKHKYTYWTDSEDRAANLLRLIRLAHQLQLHLTRTTDSRLQITPAFRQDFPTLRRVLHVPRHENTSTKANISSSAVKDRSEMQPGASKSAQSSTPGTPGWAPSVLDRQPSPKPSPAVIPHIRARETTVVTYQKVVDANRQSESSVHKENFDDKTGYASASPSTQSKSVGRQPCSDSSSPIVKCVSLDMLNDHSAGTATSDFAPKRLGASSESHLLVMPPGPIVPVRL